MSIRAAIVGPTGYSGLHAIQLLLRHPSAEVTYLASRRSEPVDIGQVFPQLHGRLSDSVTWCRPIDAKAIAEAADVALLCLPHGAAMQAAPELLAAGLRVIDLSADYRLGDAERYERAYARPHEDTKNLAHAVYGLTEIYREDIADAALVANPGCYPSCAALAIAPLLERGLASPDRIIVNAASGVTGAGRAAKASLQYAEHNESYYPYGTIGAHRHQPEIEQVLSGVAGRAAGVLFVPHLLPIDCGILETIYLEPADAHVTDECLYDALNTCYADERFVRVKTQLPNVKHVRGTNFCDVTVRVAGDRIIVFAALDNMIKGASGQAVQNMNVMFGQEESAGLL